MIGCAPVYKIPVERHKIPSKKQRIPLIRVALGEQSNIEIRGSKLFILPGGRQVKSDKKVSGGLYFKAMIVSQDSDSVFIDATPIIGLDWPVKITSNNDAIEFNSRTYRGEFTIYKKGNKFLVVNKLNIEDYLRSVVPCELWTNNLEALKAQAVASRTYALYSIKDTEEYDLEATVQDQVYKGRNSENEVATRAVNETYGIVCTYNGEIIQSNYSSTCGGRTADGGLPYLTSISCPFCENSPHYKWEVSYPESKFLELITPSSVILSKAKNVIKSVRVKKRDSSGRVELLEIITDKGNYTIKGRDVRTILGLKSTFLDVNLKGNKIVINGRGQGHGIGMCQWGILGMANKGFGYESMLRYYYKDVEIKKIY
ncbi:MAG: SpoIID/LytB domain-containing protein [bacterium]|nr:SpoIID/LytB domain-containing protein [bacterium]